MVRMHYNLLAKPKENKLITSRVVENLFGKFLVKERKRMSQILSITFLLQFRRYFLPLSTMGISLEYLCFLDLFIFPEAYSFEKSIMFQKIP